MILQFLRRPVRNWQLLRQTERARENAGHHDDPTKLQFIIPCFHEYPSVHLPKVPVRRLLEGQTAIVTGASSGIGKAIAIALGAAGAKVCVNYVTGPDKAGAVVEEIENDGSHAFAKQADVSNEAEVVAMFEALPAIIIRSNGRYMHEPFWYRNFLYLEERRRGLDCTEDLASPGLFEWEISKELALWVLSSEETRADDAETLLDLYISPRETEQARRERFASPIYRAGDAYIVKRGDGKTIIAGYPWFGEWGATRLSLCAAYA